MSSRETESSKSDAEFVESVVDGLDKAVQDYEELTLVRLRAARKRALDQAPGPGEGLFAGFPWGRGLGLPVAATALVAAVVVGLYLGEDTASPGSPALAEVPPTISAAAGDGDRLLEADASISGPPIDLIENLDLLLDEAAELAEAAEQLDWLAEPKRG